MSQPSQQHFAQEPVTQRDWEHPPRPPIDIEGHIVTERQRPWRDDRTAPPPEAAPDPWERWSLVRAAARANASLGMAVDHVRRIERAVRPDRRMVSRRGELEPMTIIALMWFQRDQGLPITGIADRRTLDTLFATRPWRRRPRPEDERPERILVPDDASPLERFLFYRSLVLDAGGLFDSGHRAVNVLVLRDAELVQGARGASVRDTGRPWAFGDSHAFTTVSVWVERDRDCEQGDVVDVVIRERAGLVPLQSLRRELRRPELPGGQYICDLGTSGPFLPDAHAVVPRFSDKPGAIPVRPPKLRLARGLDDKQIAVPIDPSVLRYGAFVSELARMQEVQRRADGWAGVRITLLEAAAISPLLR